MHEPLPLAGRTIIEHVDAASSDVVVRAIAIAGRIAADLGAAVIRRVATSDPLAGHPNDHRFLNGGKIVASADAAANRDADAVLADAGRVLPESLGHVPVKVMVGHGVPAALGVPDASVTDTTILALSGLLDLIGAPDQAPVPLGGHQASGVAGLAAFSGMMAAFAAGKPETVQVSALEACLWSNWKSYAERLYMGRSPTRQGRPARRPRAVPASMRRA